MEKTIDIIGDEAFCDILISRTIPEGMPVDFYDEAVKKLRVRAITCIDRLESVRFPNVTDVRTYGISENPALKRISLPACRTLGSNSLRGNPVLEEVDAPLVTSSGEFFLEGSRVLTSVSFPNMTTTGSGALYSCYALAEVNLPKLKSVPSYTFISCTSLEQLDLPSVTSISNEAFKNCSSLMTVNIGPGIKTISATAFETTPDGMVINLPVAEGAVANAPWGATNAVIHYNTPYSGNVPIPN